MSFSVSFMLKCRHRGINNYWSNTEAPKKKIQFQQQNNIVSLSFTAVRKATSDSCRSHCRKKPILLYVRFLNSSLYSDVRWKLTAVVIRTNLTRFIKRLVGAAVRGSVRLSRTKSTYLLLSCTYLCVRFFSVVFALFVKAKVCFVSVVGWVHISDVRC